LAGLNTLTKTRCQVVELQSFLSSLEDLQLGFYKVPI